MIKIGIIEDNNFQLTCYIEFFKEISEIEVVCSYRSIEEIKVVTAKNQSNSPDLVILDYQLLGISGTEAIEYVKTKFHGCKIITLTAHNESKHVIDALLAGSSAFILKSPNLMELYSAILEVNNNGAIFSSKAAIHLIDHIKSPVNSNAFNLLTKREQELIELVKSGLTYKEMAQRLSLSVHTINYHLKNIYEKFQVNSKSELISKIYKSKL